MQGGEGVSFAAMLVTFHSSTPLPRAEQRILTRPAPSIAGQSNAPISQESGRFGGLVRLAAQEQKAES